MPTKTDEPLNAMNHLTAQVASVAPHLYAGAVCPADFEAVEKECPTAKPFGRGQASHTREDAVITTDGRGRVTFLNRSAETLIGGAQQDAIGRPLGEVFRIFDGETQQFGESSVSEALRLGEVVGFGKPRILHGVAGQETPIVDSCFLIKDGGGRIDGAVLIFRDMTLRRKELQELVEAQAALTYVCRVNTMGELAASIAHEVNQPLAGVVTNGKACLRWLEKVSDSSPALEEVREALKRIVRDANRAGDIVARTRNLFQKTDATRAPLNINSTIQGIVLLVRGELLANQITLRLDLAPDLPSVSGDSVQIQQVMLNLILNAVEAINLIETSLREIVIKTQRIDEDKVCIEVQDSGIGLDPGRSEKIFEAFHSTKVGGMGMGLSISRSIVESHGGRICTLPSEDHGATFQFTLPTDAFAYSTTRDTP